MLCCVLVEFGDVCFWFVVVWFGLVLVGGGLGWG